MMSTKQKIDKLRDCVERLRVWVATDQQCGSRNRIGWENALDGMAERLGECLEEIGYEM